MIFVVVILLCDWGMVSLRGPDDDKQVLVAADVWRDEFAMAQTPASPARLRLYFKPLLSNIALYNLLVQKRKAASSKSDSRLLEV